MCDDLENITETYGLNDEIQFGKHKGSRIKDVIYDDVSYVEWALDSVDHFELNEEAAEYYANVLDNEAENERDNKSLFYDEQY